MYVCIYIYIYTHAYVIHVHMYMQVSVAILAQVAPCLSTCQTAIRMDIVVTTGPWRTSPLRAYGTLLQALGRACSLPILWLILLRLVRTCTLPASWQRLCWNFYYTTARFSTTSRFTSHGCHSGQSSTAFPFSYYIFSTSSSSRSLSQSSTSSTTARIGRTRGSVQFDYGGYTRDIVCYHCRVPGGLPPAGNSAVCIPTMRCMAHRRCAAQAAVHVSPKSWQAACSLAEGLKHRSSASGHWEGELGIRLPDEYQGDTVAAGSYVWSVRTAAYYHVFLGGVVCILPPGEVDPSASVGSIGWYCGRVCAPLGRVLRYALAHLCGALLERGRYGLSVWRDMYMQVHILIQMQTLTLTCNVRIFVLTCMHECTDVCYCVGTCV